VSARALGPSARAAAATALLSLLAVEVSFAQCSMCNMTIAQSVEGRAMSEKLNLAILVMFVAPYLVFGTIAAVLFRARLTPVLTKLVRLLFLPR
jgi:predicted Co/Zn/Cd cation transporter (cation efflux family)